MKRKIIITLLFLFPLCVSFGAATSNIIPCVGDKPCTLADISVLIVNIIKFLVKIAVPCAIIALAYGGFKMIASQGNPGEIGKAKDVITNAIIGLVITVAAYFIVDAIVKGLKG